MCENCNTLFSICSHTHRPRFQRTLPDSEQQRTPHIRRLEAIAICVSTTHFARQRRLPAVYVTRVELFIYFTSYFQYIYAFHRHDTAHCRHAVAFRARQQRIAIYSPRRCNGLSDKVAAYSSVASLQSHLSWKPTAVRHAGRCCCGIRCPAQREASPRPIVPGEAGPIQLLYGRRTPITEPLQPASPYDVRARLSSRRATVQIFAFSSQTLIYTHLLACGLDG